MTGAPIGIFDSGLGGLTVARAIVELLPRESTIYFGDTARVPYGPKSPAVVRRYSLEILDWMVRQGAKAVVVACNTSTAHALEALVSASPVPVLGVIDPGARAAAARAEAGRPIGVIGTAGTIASGAYERALRRLQPEAAVISRACPLFVPLVEEGWLDHAATRLVAEEYLGPIRAARPTAVVLGCTHYPLLVPVLGDVLGREVALIDSAAETARATRQLLRDHELVATDGQGEVLHRWAVSDDPERFRAVASRFLGRDVGAAEVVALGSH